MLKAFEAAAVTRHLSYYKGKRMAVDGYCWLHKSVLLLTNEILDNPNSKKYLGYLVRRLEHLLQFNIIPVLVFDGDKLPMKKLAEQEREKHRDEVRNYAITLLNQGLLKEAQAKMTEAYDINPVMAYEFIKELKKRNIEYYVAPYEADAQLAYLSRKGLVDCVITEDSDLLALGCKKVLFKLDAETGLGREISIENRGNCQGFDFSSFSDDKFLTFCILTGCDYFKIKGLGIKGAYNAIKNVNSYTKCLENIKTKCPSIQIGPSKIEEFEKAFLTFKYQVIYCPIKKEMTYSHSLQNSRYKFLQKYIKDLSFLGTIYDKETTNKIVFGEIDPITHQPFKENNSPPFESIQMISEKLASIADKENKENLDTFLKAKRQPPEPENEKETNQENPQEEKGEEEEKTEEDKVEEKEEDKVKEKTLPKEVAPVAVPVSAPAKTEKKTDDFGIELLKELDNPVASFQPIKKGKSENEKSVKKMNEKPIEISSGSSTPVKPKLKAVGTKDQEVINLDSTSQSGKESKEKEGQNLNDKEDNMSIIELEEFDDFLDNFDKGFPKKKKVEGPKRQIKVSKITEEEIVDLTEDDKPVQRTFKIKENTQKLILFGNKATQKKAEFADLSVIEEYAFKQNNYMNI